MPFNSKSDALQHYVKTVLAIAQAYYEGKERPEDPTESMVLLGLTYDVFESDVADAIRQASILNVIPGYLQYESEIKQLDEQMKEVKSDFVNLESEMRAKLQELENQHEALRRERENKRSFERSTRSEIANHFTNLNVFSVLQAYKQGSLDWKNGYTLPSQRPTQPDERFTGANGEPLPRYGDVSDMNRAWG